MSLTVIGAEQCVARLTAMAVAGQVAGMALVGQGAEIVKEELRARAPVLSGRLRDSIDVVEQEDSIEESSASVGATVEYDRYYQFGTSKMPARPYSEDAADAAGDGVLRLAVSLFGRI